MGFWKSVGYWLLLIAGALLLAFEYFLVTPIKASVAVSQLEDNAALYAIGKATATSNVSTVIFIAAVVMIIVGAYKLLTGKKKVTTNENDK